MVKESLKLGLILLLICGISTGLLAYVNDLTAPVIYENELAANKAAMLQVMPSAEQFREVSQSLSKAFDKDGNLKGYTVKVSPSGYGGEISMMIGVNTDYTVSGVQILSLSETPGLGAKAQDEAFLTQFTGKNDSMELKKDINAISGATITSTAVISGVKEAIGIAKAEGGNK
ncbi:MAG: RnfABCDGE type electron transport complex subunit G [Ruminococcaceae bacterium]|nr:RnfABCDGE type electron transport complex subunit G [Oscillospiraceae bacterium]